MLNQDATYLGEEAWQRQLILPDIVLVIETLQLAFPSLILPPFVKELVQ